MNSEFNIEDCLRQSEICNDAIDFGHAERVALSLNQKPPVNGSHLPLLWHWAFFVRGQPYDVLGPDGHPASGGFPTPIQGRSRMWAGGRVQFCDDLIIGTTAQRQSRVIRAQEKQGSSGKLLFLTVQHDYVQNNKICITEKQDIVYRTPAPPKLTGTKPAPKSDWLETIQLDTVHLFRYSAVTFNGHRIHYDMTYAREVESYPGLVVHGPMIATLMLQAFVNANPGKRVKDISYRGLRPLILLPGAFANFNVGGKYEDPGQATIWAEQNGTLAHQAKINYE